MFMRKFQISLCAVVGSCLVLGSAGAASFDWQSSWGVFPSDLYHGMNLVNTSTPEVPLLTNGVLLISNNLNSEALYYITPPGNVLMPTNLTIETQMRVDSETSSVLYRTGAGIFFTTSSNIGNGLWIGNGLIFLLAGDGSMRGPSATVDTTNSFHTYRIEVAGTNTGNAVTVYQDGVLQLTGSLLNSASLNGATPRIGFGDGSIDASGTSEWETFTANASLIPSTNLWLSIASDSTLTLHGLPTKTYLIQAKTNLSSPSWDAVTNITLPQPAYPFTDPQAGVLPARYYQAVESP